METRFRKGDKVVLKTGSLPMRVKKVTDNLVMCTWFDENCHKQEDTFEESELHSWDSHERSLKSYSVGNFDPRL